MANKVWKIIGISDNHIIIHNKKDNLFYVYALLTQADYDFDLVSRLNVTDEYEIAFSKGEFTGTIGQYKQSLNPDQWLDYWPAELEELALKQAYDLGFLYIDLEETLTFDEFKDLQLLYA